jgi:hypothetical protein
MKKELFGRYSTFFLMGENKKLKEDPFRGSQQVFLDKYIEPQNEALGYERMKKKHPKFIGPVNFEPIRVKQTQNGGSLSNYIFNPVNGKKYLLNSLHGKRLLKSYIKFYNNMKK